MHKRSRPAGKRDTPENRASTLGLQKESPVIRSNVYFLPVIVRSGAFTPGFKLLTGNGIREGIPAVHSVPQEQFVPSRRPNGILFVLNR